MSNDILKLNPIVPSGLIEEIKYFSPSYDGIEITINQLLNGESIMLPIENSIAHYRSSDADKKFVLDNNIGPIEVAGDSVVIQFDHLSLGSFFKKSFKTHLIPILIIYEGVKLKYNNENILSPSSTAPQNIKKWYANGSSNEHIPEGIQIFPVLNKFKVKILNNECLFIDPAYILKHLGKKSVYQTHYEISAEYNDFLNKIDSKITLDIRNEWNEPFLPKKGLNISYEPDANSTSDSVAVEIPIVLENGFFYIDNSFYIEHKTSSGYYKIDFDPTNSNDSHLSVSPYNEKIVTPDSLSKYYNFRIIDGEESDYIIIQCIDLEEWYVQGKENEFGHLYTSGNEANFFVDGEDYFHEIYKTLNNNSEINGVFFTNWRFDYDVKLLAPENPNYEKSTLGLLLEKKFEGKYYGILWDQSNPSSDKLTETNQFHVNNDSFILLNNKIKQSNDERYLRVLLDEYNLPCSHHQKTFIIQSNSNLTAYCGGLDLAFQRWDNKSHDSTHPNRFLPKEYTSTIDYKSHQRLRNTDSPMQAWHDVHVKIEGDSAHDIYENFKQRWNDSKINLGVYLESYLEKINGNNNSIVFNPSSPLIPPRLENIISIKKENLPDINFHNKKLSNKYIKISRTYRNLTKTNISFSIVQNIIHCIRKAKYLIYIEDQYIVSIHIAKALKLRLHECSTLKVIMVTSHISDIPGIIDRRKAFLKAMDYYNYAGYLDLTEPEPSQQTRDYKKIRAGLYHPKNINRDYIYVHSKLMIVDDIWAYIGSANLNNRSFNGDSEIGAMIIDGEICKGRRRFALSLRRKLWMEHLDLGEESEYSKYNNLVNYEKSIYLWDKKSREQNSRIESMNTYKTKANILKRSISYLVDNFADGVVDPWEISEIYDPDNPDTPFVLEDFTRYLE